tara:strand:+ start:718 stop:2607 length:1890 start_codon:yes stop_codon:yes gene_type:complete
MHWLVRLFRVIRKDEFSIGKSIVSRTSALKLVSQPGTRRHIQRLMQTYVAPYKTRLSLGLFCMLVLSAASVAPAKLIEDVVNKIFVDKDPSMLLPVTLLVVGAFLLKGLAHFGASVFMDYVGQRVICDIQKDLARSLLKADLAFFHETPTGELVSRFTNDVDKLRNAVTGTLTSLGKDTLTFLFFLALMFYQDWFLASISFFVLPVAILPVARIGKRIRKASTNIQEETASLVILLTQAFQGMRLVKSYCMEHYEQSRLCNLVETIFKKTYKASRSRSATHPLMESLGGIAIAIVILYGGSEVIQGTQTPGAFFSFIAALMLVYEPLKRLANLNANLQEQLGAASRIFAALDYKAQIESPNHVESLDKVEGNLRFEDVSFAYHDSQTILDNINLEIQKGQKVAFVGASGAGKSTLLNLIPRFYDVTKGRVLLDGVDICSITLEELRQAIALVSQEVILFDETIRANISYGSLKATQSQIEQAAKLAAAHEFVTELPKGYDTVVGEQGVKLSGGQRQRLSIARAMLKNAPVLLLDEPTSALDSASEKKVQKALDTLMKGRTTLVIAHRLATVRDANVIYVMDQGKIVASGHHEHLLETSEHYRYLCASQLGKDETNIKPVSSPEKRPYGN